ncbi:unnamed protein product [Didymodactylos carnosus]|uniref:Uncharacterized protein n=1 Tax=Didymodactylos carnosus TaxID=1234261 RepID=A0A813XQ41_9BILA|nr:unnamed protein product [Didymodactylos carnosus]CAF1535015.1 unnamed protein product [Didymodactylos carnosus]CAF3663342.1 unnamed protein product [Didymodactylos carnosus]CAF4322545.1 unnamed protein product [Didymodactylos carnosus]
MRRERVYFDHSNPLEYMTENRFLARYRCPEQAVVDLLNEIEHHLQRPISHNHAIPSVIQLLTTLCFYANGSFFCTDGDVRRLSKTSVPAE